MKFNKYAKLKWLKNLKIDNELPRSKLRGIKSTYKEWAFRSKLRGINPDEIK
jgi:hypothetical protein